MKFLSRVGGFFLLIGLICLAIFFFTEPTDGGLSSMGMLTVGVALLVVGVLLKIKNRPDEVESARFVSLRRMSQRSKEQREKRLAKRKEKEEKERGY
ncbi:MAG: hypothetical protein K8R77_07775 [Anaerolineaceae bacterium]|nr:hypothetical protein [Anaerolineaceae bacterium]